MDERFEYLRINALMTNTEIRRWKEEGSKGLEPEENVVVQKDRALYGAKPTMFEWRSHHMPLEVSV